MVQGLRLLYVYQVDDITQTFYYCSRMIQRRPIILLLFNYDLPDTTYLVLYPYLVPQAHL